MHVLNRCEVVGFFFSALKMPTWYCISYNIACKSFYWCNLGFRSVKYIAGMLYMKGKLMTATRMSRRILLASLMADAFVYISCHAAQAHSRAVQKKQLVLFPSIRDVLLLKLLCLFHTISKLLSNPRRAIYSFDPRWTSRTKPQLNKCSPRIVCFFPAWVKSFNTDTNWSKWDKLMLIWYWYN